MATKAETPAEQQSAEPKEVKPGVVETKKAAFTVTNYVGQAKK